MVLMPDFWLTHKQQLRGYIVKRMQDKSAVDDVMQDVFVKAYSNLHSVKSPESLSAWLYRIAANAIADHYRASRPSDSLTDDLPSPEPESTDITELASCLNPFIAQLPETYRLPIVLSEIEGLTQKEVALRLGLSLSGAKSRVQRGREKLRQRLNECCQIELGRCGIVSYEVRQQKNYCD